MTLHEAQKMLEHLRTRRIQTEVLLGELGKYLESKEVTLFYIYRHALRLEGALISKIMQELVREEN